MEQEYIIRIPHTTEERDRAIEYVSSHMYKKHGGHPPKETTPPHLFIALDGAEVVGAVGIEFGTKDTPLPFEELYLFTQEMLPVQYQREKTIYYSRWNSSRPNIGPPLWLAATEYALSCGIVHGVAITKKDMVAYCKQSLGFDWRIVSGATINSQYVQANETIYFFSQNPPLLCFSVLPDDVLLLRILVRDICLKQRIHVELP